MPRIIQDPTPAILEETKRLLFSIGYDAINMRDIAKHCGIATGTIYNYFPKKEDLMTRLMTDFWFDFIPVMDELDIHEPDFYKKIHLIFEHFRSFTYTFHDIFLTKQVREAYSGGRDYESTSKKAFMEKLQSRLVTMIQVSNYQVAGTLTTEDLAEFILSNFIAIAYSSNYSYDLFEKILKSLLT